MGIERGCIAPLTLRQKILSRRCLALLATPVALPAQTPSSEALASDLQSLHAPLPEPRGPVMLAAVRYGERLSLREKGPLGVLFLCDDQRKASKSLSDPRMIWQPVLLEVQE